MEALLDVLGQVVQFAYTCWDRIVLSGYIDRLQRPENLTYFFHAVVGIDADAAHPRPMIETLEHRHAGHHHAPARHDVCADDLEGGQP